MRNGSGHDGVAGAGHLRVAGSQRQPAPDAQRTADVDVAAAPEFLAGQKTRPFPVRLEGLFDLGPPRRMLVRSVHMRSKTPTREDLRESIRNAPADPGRPVSGLLDRLLPLLVGDARTIENGRPVSGLLDRLRLPARRALPRVLLRHLSVRDADHRQHHDRGPNDARCQTCHVSNHRRRAPERADAPAAKPAATGRPRPRDRPAQAGFRRRTDPRSRARARPQRADNPPP